MASSSPPPPPPGPPTTTSMASRGVLLFAVLLDASFFGLVSQQFYTYWISGFRDPLYMKLFVIVQYLLVAVQNVLMWNLSYSLFVVSNYGLPNSGASLWEGPTNSLVQVFIIMLANIALASRINGLTKSRIQSGTIIVLSVVAFAFGLVTIITSWKNPGTKDTRYTLPIWRSIQAIAECLITFFLARALLQSRSGIRTSDSIVYYLIRNVIQTGLLATTWSIAALGTWFLLPRVSTYRIFDITSGVVYTQAMFESLLWRTRLREQMSTSTPQTYLDLGTHTQQSQLSGRFRISGRMMGPAPFDVSVRERELGQSLNVKGDVLELECFPSGKAEGSHRIA